MVLMAIIVICETLKSIKNTTERKPGKPHRTASAATPIFLVNERADECGDIMCADIWNKEIPLDSGWI